MQPFMPLTRASLLGALGAALLAAVSAPAGAAPVIDPGSGHAYEFIGVADPFAANNNAWATASAAAAASVFNGVSGHLATVTSQAENDFLVSLVGTPPEGFNGAWLGGDFQGWLEGPEAGKTFAEVGGFANWNAVEPNNNGLMYMSIGTATPNGGSAGKWLDDSGVNGLPDASLDPVIGYFVEYESELAQVPEPPLGLAVLSLGLLLVARRRAC